MNSRQKRKAKYAASHEAPIKNHWVKTSEFGKIGDCNKDSKFYKDKIRNTNRMNGIKSNLKAFGLWSKHTGSSKMSKLIATINTYAPAYQAYKTVINKAVEKAVHDEEMRKELGLGSDDNIEQAEIVNE